MFNYREVVYFYDTNGYKKAWEGKEDIFLDIVAYSYYHGLNPEKYRVDFGSDRFLNDVLITDRLITLAKDISIGRVLPKEIFPTWNCKPKKDFIVDKIIKMREVFSKETFYQTFSPNYYQYSLLLKEFERYDTIAKKLNQKMIKIRRPLKVGDRDDVLLYIKEYLFLVGDLKDKQSLDSNEFDIYLTEAVKSFQLRHGLKPDGVIGVKTVEAINYPFKERLNDIAINLEKARWIEDSLAQNRLEINIPSYNLNVFVGQKFDFSMKVIVGRGDPSDFRPTHIHCGKINKIVFNPYWYVPRRIAIKDLLPKIKKNPNFLQKNGFKVFLDGREVQPSDIKLGRVDEKSFRYRFVQQPGDKNSLGKLKIDFENPFDIYLHDTPYKELFDKESRDLSSGCIRLEDAQRLAMFILLQDGYGIEFIDNLFNETKTIEVNIRSIFMVYIFYFTVYVQGDRVFFYKDIYRYDKILKSKLSAR